MLLRSKYRVALMVVFAALLTISLCPRVSAQDDVFHIVKGTVKHIDKDTKTMVVKAGDGTEWTDKTTVEGGKDIGDGIKEGSKVSVKYTEKAGEKTAVGVKDVGKGAAKAVN
jgi:Cu/Ag efflux protein CusF